MAHCVQAYNAETDRLLANTHKIDEELQLRLNESNDKFSHADAVKRGAEKAVDVKMKA